jgi:dihydroneopterin aldolase
MRISLSNLEFFGFHGLYEGEKKMGNQFLVDIQIDFSPNVAVINELDQTIDYVSVYNKVKEIMGTPTPLLETLVCKIADQILLDHSIADKVFVQITKQKLAIPNFVGDTAVSIERIRN